MKIHSYISHIVVACLLLSSMHSRAINSRIIMGVAGAVSVGIGSLLLGACFLKKSTSNQKVLSQARATYTNAKDTYENALSQFEQTFVMESMNKDEQQSQIRLMTEDVLHAVAPGFVQVFVRLGNGYWWGVGNTLEELSVARAKLIERIYSVQKSTTKQSKKLADSMQSTQREIDYLMTRLTPYNLFIKEHSDYFDMYRLIREIRNTYAVVMDMMVHGCTSDEALYAINAHISSGKYPYFTYVNDIENYIQALKKYSEKNTHRYPVITQEARILCDILLHIKACVVNTKKYDQDRAAYQQEQAMKRHEEEERRLEEEKKRLIEERNRLLKEQNRIHAMAVCQQNAMHFAQQQPVVIVQQPQQPMNNVMPQSAPQQNNAVVERAAAKDASKKGRYSCLGCLKWW